MRIKMFQNIAQILGGRSEGRITPPVPAPVTAKDKLRKALFANGPVLPQSSASIASGISIESLQVVSDYTSLYGASSNLARVYAGQHADASFRDVTDVLGAIDSQVAYHAFGSISAMNAVIGLIEMKGAYDQMAYANALDDKRGLLINRLSLGANVAFAGTGLSTAVTRPLMMASALEKASSVSLLGRATAGASMAGSVFYTIFFSIISIVLGIQLYDGVKFRRKLSKASDIAEEIEVLQKQLKVRPERVFDKMIAKEMRKFAHLPKKEQTAKAEEAARHALVSEAMDASKGAIKELMESLGIESVSEEKLEAIVKMAIGSAYAGKSPEQLSGLIQSDLMLAGLQMKVKKVELKKLSKVGRVMTSRGFEAIKLIASKPDLVGRIRAGDTEAIKEAQSLVDTIKAGNRHKITETAVTLGIVTVGLIAMILPLIFMAGPGLLVAAVVMLAFTMLMSGMDGYHLYQSYTGDRPQQHDKKVIIASTVLALASLFTVIALSGAGIISLGVLPLILMSVLTVLWLGQNAVAWKVMNHNEAKHQLENPTLETFLEALKSKKEREKIMEMMKNLPEAIQEKIQEELTAFDNDMEKATLSVMRKVEDAKAAHLDEMREALMPLIVT